MKISTGLILCAALAFGCDGGDEMDAGMEDAGPPPDTDAGPGDAGPPAGPIAVECVSPTFGDMIALDAGETVVVTVAVDEPERVAELRLNGDVAAIDAEGRASVTVPVGFGVHTVDVEVTGNDGDESAQICSFLVAQSYHPESDPLDDAVTMRLGPTAIADGDGDATVIESLEDLVLRTVQQGLVEQSVTVELPTGVQSVGYMCCGFQVLDTIEYVSATVTGGDLATVTAAPGMISLGSSTVTVELNANVTGDDCGECPFSDSGTITLTATSLGATLRLGVGAMGEPTVEVVNAAPFAIDSIVASFASSSVDALVQSYMQSASTVTLRSDFTATWADAIAQVLSGTLASPASPLPVSVDVPAVGGTTVPIMITLGPSSSAQSMDDLIVGASTFVAPPGSGGPSLPATEGIALSGSELQGISAASGEAGVMVSEAVLNQVLHGHWRAGGLNGIVAPDMIIAPDMIVAPDMIIAPDMIVAPDMIRVSAGLPVVTDLSSGGLEVMLGGVTAELSGSGPWAGGVEVRLAVSASASLPAGSGTDPSWDLTELTALHVSYPGGLTAGQRTAVRAYAGVLGYALASFAVNEGTPELPVMGLTAPSSVLVDGAAFDTGIAAGTELGIVAPDMSVAGDHLEAVGDLGTW